jgi:hypothetical protein
MSVVPRKLKKFSNWVLSSQSHPFPQPKKLNHKYIVCFFIFLLILISLIL